MTNTKTLLFLSRIAILGRLMNDDEAFDFYTENVMRNQVTCKWNPYPEKPRHEDYKLWELEQKAAQWHRLTIGSLALKGLLPVQIERGGH